MVDLMASTNLSMHHAMQHTSIAVVTIPCVPDTNDSVVDDVCVDILHKHNISDAVEDAVATLYRK